MKASANPLLRAVKSWRRKLPAKFLVGVSGGADSVALLHALVECGYRPHVCHLNHRWRGKASDEDEQFVRDVASRLGLAVTTARVKVAPTEDRARRARLRFFERVAQKAGTRTLLLAHTADDQAETVLMRLIRGAGPTGLTGMAADRPIGKLRVVRPLLTVTRAEVLNYLKARRLAWREDASNGDVRFLRNRVRHRLLPMLEREFNPGIRRVLLRTAEIMRAEAGEEPVATERRAVRRQFGNLSFQQVEEVRKQWTQRWPVKRTGRTVIRDLGICLVSRLYKSVADIPPLRRSSLQRNTETMDAAAVGRRPFVRTWRAGDRFQPLGMAHEKKLQDFFVDAKVPRGERHRVPLLCATDGRIAWVVGYRLAEPFKLTPSTRRVLRVHWLRA